MSRTTAHDGTRREMVAAASAIVRPVDAVLLLPPALLVAVYSLPHPTKVSLALSYADPSAATMFASHLVHLDALHLATNLLLYAVVVPLAVALASLAGRRTEFYATFVVVLLALPMALSALNVVLARPRVGYGFSGLDMAFLGTLPHAVGWYVQDGLPGDRHVDPSPVLFFIGTAVIAFWAVPPSPASLAAGGASLAAAGLYLREVARAIPGPTVAAVDRAAREWRGFGFALAAVLLVVLVPLAAFPPNPVGDGSVLNVYVHLVGFCFGYVVPYVAFTVPGVEWAHASSA